METTSKPIDSRLAPAPLESWTATRVAFAALRNRLVHEALGGASGETAAKLVRLAAVDAEGQAWSTAFPLLFFPGLFEEKARRAMNYAVGHETDRLRLVADGGRDP
jgi:hypothetical protein